MTYVQYQAIVKTETETETAPKDLILVDGDIQQLYRSSSHIIQVQSV